MPPIEEFWRKKLRKKDWIKIEQSRGVEQTNKEQAAAQLCSLGKSLVFGEKTGERDFCTVPDYHAGEAGYIVSLASADRKLSTEEIGKDSKNLLINMKLPCFKLRDGCKGKNEHVLLLLMCV